jgi:hypothetical protein
MSQQRIEELKTEIKCLREHIEEEEAQLEAFEDELAALISPFQAGDTIEIAPGKGRMYVGRWRVERLAYRGAPSGGHDVVLRVINIKKDGSIGNRTVNLYFWNQDGAVKVQP